VDVEVWPGLIMRYRRLFSEGGGVTCDEIHKGIIKANWHLRSPVLGKCNSNFIPLHIA